MRFTFLISGKIKWNRSIEEIFYHRILHKLSLNLSSVKTNLSKNSILSQIQDGIQYGRYFNDVTAP